MPSIATNHAAANTLPQAGRDQLFDALYDIDAAIQRATDAADEIAAAVTIDPAIRGELDDLRARLTATTGLAMLALL